MLYMFLLYSDDSLPAPPEVMEQHEAVEGPARKAGAYICSEALVKREARTVRVRGGKAVVTDGPFAETKEVLGGFYIIDCRDLDEALEYARRIPDAQFGAVEVRAVVGGPDSPWDYVASSENRTRAPWSAM
jgi:hypothetical protein